MKFLRNIPFIIWMLFQILIKVPTGRRVDRYRKQDDYVQERREILSATGDFGPRVLKRFGAHVDVWGLDKIPEGPVLFVSNHQGYGDIFVYLGLITMKQIGFVSKEELLKLPFFGKWIKRVRSIALERNDTRETLKVFQIGEDWLREGFSLVIFPEGTRSRSDGMDSFKRGSLRLATRTGVPIVPVSILGAWRLFEEKGYVQPAEVKFYVHDPIPTAGLSRTEINEVSERVETVIREKIDEWNAASVAASEE